MYKKVPLKSTKIRANNFNKTPVAHWQWHWQRQGSIILFEKRCSLMENGRIEFLITFLELGGNSEQNAKFQIFVYTK